MSAPLEKTVNRMAKDVFCDFLTITIHGLLHSRQVYPAGAFKLRQKFSIPVQVCYHPQVFDYISSLTDTLSSFLQDGKLHAMHIFIGTPNCDWEQFTIRILAFDDLKTQAQHNSLMSSLRACLLKMAIVDTYLPRRVSGEITWRVEIDADDSQMDSNQSWIKSEPTVNVQTRKIIPIKTVTTDCVQVEVYATRLA